MGGPTREKTVLVFIDDVLRTQVMKHIRRNDALHLFAGNASERDRTVVANIISIFPFEQAGDDGLNNIPKT